jgi:hypothetical protein
MLKGIFSFILLNLLAVIPASAQHFIPREPSFTFRTSIDRVSKLTENPSGVLASGLIPRLTTQAKAQFEWRNGQGHRIFIDPFVRFNHFPTNVDEFIFGVFVQYRHSLPSNDKIELRWTAGFERSQDIYDRATLQLKLKTRHNKSSFSQATLRYRYRDQDDAKTFVGFDQHELYASFAQTITPSKGPIKRVTGKIYGDVRQADAARFDYTEVGAQVNVRFDVHQDWKLIAKANGFVRQYRSDFLTSDVSRRDQRMSVGLEVRYDLGAKQTISGTIAFEKNRSTIQSRAYSGGVFRLEYKKRFK